MINYCKTCLFPEMKRLTLNDDGICQACEAEKKIYEEFKKDSYINKMTDLFTEVKKEKKSYDVVAMFSGGKDSAYLLYLLKIKFKLKVLALSIIHPLVNELSLKNMENVTEKLGIDLKKIVIDNDIFKKYISEGIKLSEKYELGPHFGCDLCNFIKYGVAYNFTISEGIPIFTTGIDSNQTIPHLKYGDLRFKSLQPFLGKESRYKKIFKQIFGDKYDGSIYDFDLEKNKEKLPIIIYPFTFLNYNPEEARIFLDKKNILPAKDSSSFLTNCSAIPFFNYLSYKKFGTLMSVDFSAREFRKNKSVTIRGKKFDRTNYFKYVDEVFKLYKAVLNNENINYEKDLPVMLKFLKKQELHDIIKSYKLSIKNHQYFSIEA